MRVSVNPVRENEPVTEADSSLHEAAEVAGDRWVLLTLAALREGARRFGDLSADLPGIAPNILIDRLRRMERQGLITAAPYSQRPKRFVYDLTESGRELAVVLPALAGWAARRGGGRGPRHGRCGTPLEVRLWCPVCAEAVEPDHTHEAADAELRWL
jgi:DNA-binding HxlR family transcriptional regulator